MAVWPSSLGSPVIAEHTLTRRPRVVKTEMETGIPHHALVSKHGLTSGPVAFYWTETQHATFETFFETTLLGGSVYVDDFPLDMIDGVVGHEAYLSDVSDAVVMPGGLYKVTMTVETDERNT